MNHRNGQRERLQHLSRWATANGAFLNPSVELSITNEGAALVANNPIEKNEVIVACPPHLTLSYLNAVDAEPFRSHSPGQSPLPFPPEFMAKVPHHVIGRFFLIHQLSNLGKDSFWYPYIATLPQPSKADLQACKEGILVLGDGEWELPPFWGESDRGLLEATNAGTAAEDIRQRVDQEYENAIKFIRGEVASKFPRLLYYWACCIFSSRSFRPRLTISSAILSNALKRESIQPGTGDDDFSILMPLFDVGNHDPLAKVVWDPSDGQTCSLRIPDSRFERGAQVFNWYGNKTNAELLVGYNFICSFGRRPGIHNGYVHVTKAKRLRHGGRVEEYLISLKPMAGVGSIRGRETVLIPADRILVKGFEHFEQRMVWDIIFHLCQGSVELIEDVWEVRDGHTQKLANGIIDIGLLEVVLGTFPFPNEDAAEIVSMTLKTLLRQVVAEKEKLDKVSVASFSNKPRHQLIADYRCEVRMVLEAARDSVCRALEEQHQSGQ